MKKKLGKDLIFISRILRDGSGTEPVLEEDVEYFDKLEFRINPLSAKNRTFIACEFNSYVVRLKEWEEQHQKKRTKEVCPHCKNERCNILYDDDGSYLNWNCQT